MLSLKDFTPRAYQLNILETCKQQSCLVVLPTGIGKTAISMLLAIHRLNEYPSSKILLCSPTKPLCSQHYSTFLQYTTISKDEISLLTGNIPAKDRKALWQKSRIIIATPQTVQSDIENHELSLKDFSLLCIDEAHRSRMNYANTIIASIYSSQASNPLILGLTASPGGTRDRIQEICKNLNIQAVEIRTEFDEDVKQYVQKKEIEYIMVELPKELINIRDMLKSIYKAKVAELRKYGLTKPASIVSKKDLLAMQPYLRKEISSGNNMAYWGISLVAQALKIEHAIELLETQGISQLIKYLSSLSSEQTKAAKAILKDASFIKARDGLDNLNNLTHPKLSKLSEIITSQLSINPDSRVIIFANFRDTVDELFKFLSSIKNARPSKLIGQKLGLSQKQQIEVIKQFESGINNILITTSIGEEGLSIKEANLAIFYDAVSSEIRSIQRSGRVARVQPGKIIFLITKNSRDEAYYWTAKRKERVMKQTLDNLKGKKDLQGSLFKKWQR